MNPNDPQFVPPKLDQGIRRGNRPTVTSIELQPDAGGWTVRKALAQWQRLAAIGKKENTLEYHKELLRQIEQHWPNLDVNTMEVTNEQLVQFAEGVMHFSAVRYNAMISIVRLIVPRAWGLPRRRVIPPEKHIPTVDEFKRLLVALDTAYSGHAALVIRFLAHCGARINEARQLKWEHVREDHIYLPADITKNGRPRCIPFVEGMAETLESLRRVRLTTSKRKEFVLPQSNCGIALRYACALVGLPKVSHHTFRHYFSTRCIQSGVDIPTVAKWLGHLDNGALLLRWYCHLLDEHSTEMAKKVKVGAIPEKAEVKNIVDLPRENESGSLS